MRSVEKILDGYVPSPAFSLRPGRNTPLPLDSFERQDEAWAKDPVSGLYESVDDGEPRIFGGRQGLLIEGKGTTNRILRSSDISKWQPNDVATNPADNIIAGKDAHEVVATGGNAFVKNGSGNFTGGTENLYALVERGTADVVTLQLYDNQESAKPVEQRFNLPNQSTSTSTGSVEYANAYFLDQFGPNGGRMYLLSVTFNSLSEGSGDVFFFPDEAENSGSTYFYHAQLSRYPQNSEPIVTSGSAKTTFEESATIFEGGKPDWWNPQEMTFIVEFEPRSLRSFKTHTILGGSSLFFYYAGLNTTPFEIKAFDGSKGVDVGGAAPAFQPTKAAITVTKDEMRISVNGETSRETGANGADMLNVDRLELGGNTATLFYSVSIIPRAMPLTPADRTSGDPVSLKTITS